MTFTRWLTIGVMLIWLVSLTVRVLMPTAVTAFTGLDAIVLLVIGYYFSVSSITKRPKGIGSV